MKQYALISLLFLTGCDTSLFHGIIKSAGTSQTMTVLIMGQSNAERFSTPKGGEDGFKSVLPNTQFINCAVGGTGLEEWKKGGELYNECLEAVGKTKIDIIWWDQGEYEAEGGIDGTADGANSWAEHFTALVASFKHDFKCPVFFARLGDFNDPSPWWNIVRQQQVMIDFNIASMVSLDGIAPIQNDRHYTYEGYYQIGRRLALSIKDRP